MADSTFDETLKELEQARERLAERIRQSEKALDELDAKIVAIKQNRQISKEVGNPPL